MLLYTKIECQSSTLPRSNARPTPNGYFHALRLVVLQRIDPASKTTVARARCTFPTFPCTGAPHAARAAPAQSATVFNPHRLPPLPPDSFPHEPSLVQRPPALTFFLLPHALSLSTLRPTAWKRFRQNDAARKLSRRRLC